MCGQVAGWQRLFERIAPPGGPVTQIAPRRRASLLERDVANDDQGRLVRTVPGALEGAQIVAAGTSHRLRGAAWQTVIRMPGGIGQLAPGALGDDAGVVVHLLQLG